MACFRLRNRVFMTLGITAMEQPEYQSLGSAVVPQVVEAELELSSLTKTGLLYMELVAFLIFSVLSFLLILHYMYTLLIVEVLSAVSLPFSLKGSIECRTAFGM